MESDRPQVTPEGWFPVVAPRYGEHYWQKAVLGNPHTTTAALEQLADRVLASQWLIHRINRRLRR